MKIAEVIVKTKLRKDLGVFDYEIPEILYSVISPGSIVLLPFRQREILGVVVRVKDIKKSQYKLKSLQLFRGKSLKTSSLYGESIVRIAQNLVVSPNHLLTFGFSDVPKRLYAIKSLQNFQSYFPALQFDSSITHSVSSLLQRIDFSQKFSCAVQYGRFQEKILLYFSFIKKALHAKKQIVFVFPEVSDIYDFYSFVPKEWKSFVSVWHGGMSKNDSFSSWMRIVSGESHIVLGTQVAAFLPFKNLGLAVIDNEQDLSLKQMEHNPRFSPSSVFEFRYEREDFSLIFSSFALRSETIYKYKESKTFFLSRYKNEQKTDIRLVDLRDAFLDREFHYITPITEQVICESLDRKSRVFLFFPRKGFSRRLYCKDCSSVEKCVKCGSPYTVYKDSKTSKDILKCSSCKYESDFIFTCTSCRSMNLIRKGFGIGKIQNRLQELFPGTSFLQMDGSTGVRDDGRSSIVIGTEYALRKLRYNTYDSIVFLSADEMSKRLWRSTEVWYSLLQETLMMSRSFGVRKVLFQSFHPDGEFFSSLLSENPLAFYEREIQKRKSFGYPPFVKLYRILCTSEDEKEVVYVQNQVYFKIIDQASKDDQVLRSDQIDKRGKKYYTYILIKASQNTEFDFRFFPEGVFIDAYPESFL